ncbi:hypothetical protein M6B38_305320 [Iris pallida]|uniref:Uncharacterized protein n=1 Tax=Iris pallida TaxID=29817 RepID=A0AAX6HL62_IRIPA|nr:hypothetical protein M6B38_305320 [Iris pallida]
MVRGNSAEAMLETRRGMVVVVEPGEAERTAATWWLSSDSAGHDRLRRLHKIRVRVCTGMSCKQ